jgi:cell division protein FtsL
MKESVSAKGFFRWLVGAAQIRILAVTFIALFSSFAVIYASHQTRALYGALQVGQETADNLDSEYEQLLLEQSAWAGYNRIDQLAREELGMSSPDRGRLVLMRASYDIFSVEEGRP